MPKPIIDTDTSPFWEGCRAGHLKVPRCRRCHTMRWPPGPMCPHCQSEDTDWVETSGHGRLYSWTVVTHAVDPALRNQVPYIVALVELPERIRVIANIVDCAPEALVASMELSVIFEDQDGLTIPNFRPANPGPATPSPADEQGSYPT